MLIGEKLRSVREARGLSQGDIEQRSGLLRAHLSRIENGYTVPSVETLERLARGLGIPLHALFYDGDSAPPPLPAQPKVASEKLWGSRGAAAAQLRRLVKALAAMSARERRLLLALAGKLATRRRPRRRAAQRVRA